MRIPLTLATSCTNPERSEWLADLPRRLRELKQRWSIVDGDPFENVSAAWVAPVTRVDGSRAVLKLGMPHFEADHEIAGLRFWNGDPTVNLLEADEQLGAMLLEQCIPGSCLSELPEPEQDTVIAGLLPRFWRSPTPEQPFRSLAFMLAIWAAEVEAADDGSWTEPQMVRDGLALLRELANSRTEQFVLATDLHAGNVLRAERRPWLAIDPKPFVGDPTYDATQHLLNCPVRLLVDPAATISRIAAMFNLDAERLRLWTFARCAIQSLDGPPWLAIARRLTAIL